MSARSGPAAAAPGSSRNAPATTVRGGPGTAAVGHGQLLPTAAEDIGGGSDRCNGPDPTGVGPSHLPTPHGDAPDQDGAELSAVENAWGAPQCDALSSCPLPAQAVPRSPQVSAVSAQIWKTSEERQQQHDHPPNAVAYPPTDPAAVGSLSTARTAVTCSPHAQTPGADISSALVALHGPTQTEDAGAPPDIQYHSLTSGPCSGWAPPTVPLEHRLHNPTPSAAQDPAAAEMPLDGAVRRQRILPWEKKPRAPATPPKVASLLPMTPQGPPVARTAALPADLPLDPDAVLGCGSRSHGVDPDSACTRSPCHRDVGMDIRSLCRASSLSPERVVGWCQASHSRRTDLRPPQTCGPLEEAGRTQDCLPCSELGDPPKVLPNQSYDLRVASSTKCGDTYEGMPSHPGDQSSPTKLCDAREGMPSQVRDCRNANLTELAAAHIPGEGRRGHLKRLRAAWDAPLSNRPLLWGAATPPPSAQEMCWAKQVAQGDPQHPAALQAAVSAAADEPDLSHTSSSAQRWALQMPQGASAKQLVAAAKACDATAVVTETVTGIGRDTTTESVETGCGIVRGLVAMDTTESSLEPAQVSQCSAVPSVSSPQPSTCTEAWQRDVRWIAQQLDLGPQRVHNAALLLAEGATVPFIARYRKELTQGLTDQQLRKLDALYRTAQSLERRRTEILRDLRCRTQEPDSGRGAVPVPVALATAVPTPVTVPVIVPSPSPVPVTVPGLGPVRTCHTVPVTVPIVPQSCTGHALLTSGPAPHVHSLAALEAHVFAAMDIVTLEDLYRPFARAPSPTKGAQAQKEGYGPLACAVLQLIQGCSGRGPAKHPGAGEECAEGPGGAALESGTRVEPHPLMARAGSVAASLDQCGAGLASQQPLEQHKCEESQEQRDHHRQPLLLSAAEWRQQQRNPEQPPPVQGPQQQQQQPVQEPCEQQQQWGQGLHSERQPRMRLFTDHQRQQQEPQQHQHRSQSSVESPALANGRQDRYPVRALLRGLLTRAHGLGASDRQRQQGQVPGPASGPREIPCTQCTLPRRASPTESQGLCKAPPTQSCAPGPVNADRALPGHTAELCEARSAHCDAQLPLLSDPRKGEVPLALPEASTNCGGGEATVCDTAQSRGARNAAAREPNAAKGQGISGEEVDMERDGVERCAADGADGTGEDGACECVATAGVAAAPADGTVGDDVMCLSFDTDGGSGQNEWALEYDPQESEAVPGQMRDPDPAVKAPHPDVGDRARTGKGVAPEQTLCCGSGAGCCRGDCSVRNADATYFSAADGALGDPLPSDGDGLGGDGESHTEAGPAGAAVRVVAGAQNARSGSPDPVLPRVPGGAGVSGAAPHGPVRVPAAAVPSPGAPARSTVCDEVRAAVVPSKSAGDGPDGAGPQTGAAGDEAAPGDAAGDLDPRSDAESAQREAVHALDAVKHILSEQFGKDPEFVWMCRAVARETSLFESQKAGAPPETAAPPPSVAAGAPQPLSAPSRRRPAQDFTDYERYKVPLRSAPAHRVLAALRGVEQGKLRMAVEVPAGAQQRLQAAAVRRFGLDLEGAGESDGPLPTPAAGAAATSRQSSETSEHFAGAPPAAAHDALLQGYVADIAATTVDGVLQRLQADLVAELRARAETACIDVFARNLRDLLLSPPCACKVVLGLDPGYRHGVKCAVVSRTGAVLATARVHPHSPVNAWALAVDALVRLCREFAVEVIGIGNGTASRETVALVEEVRQRQRERGGTALDFAVISEAGVSHYSASEAAAEELPAFDVCERGAISIARRLQDPLAELVKVPPSHLGIGQYQHDTDPGRLQAALQAVVEDAVAAVGVDVNTASRHLLRYVTALRCVLRALIIGGGGLRRVGGKFVFGG